MSYAIESVLEAVRIRLEEAEAKGLRWFWNVEDGTATFDKSGAKARPVETTRFLVHVEKEPK